MSTTHAQIQFSAEFLTLMVAAAGLALAALRPDPRGERTRPLAVTAFLVAGVVAFLHGSLLVTRNPDGVLSLARLAAALALAAAVPGWSGGRRSAALLWAGAAGWCAAAVAELAQVSSLVVDALLVAGSLGIGLALLAVTGRSIAARVAASAATTLLLVVLVLAVALSAVISSSLQRDELNRLSSLAHIESDQLGQAVNGVAEEARFVAGDLEGYFHNESPNPLISFDGPIIVGRLHALQALYPVGAIAYVVPGATPAVSTPHLETLAAALASNASLKRDQPGVFLVGRSVWAAAAYPERLAVGNRQVGTVLSVYPFDGTYLKGRNRVDPSVSLALATARSVLASVGPQPPAATVGSLAAKGRGTELTANRFFAVVGVPVATRGQSMSLVLSTPATGFLSTRTQLYRTLFLIVLGGTVLALGVAAFTGDRITAGIRRLTHVASRIEGGNTSERAVISGDDEVATLGSAFDSMVDAVEEQASALQDAADDETRLRNRLEAVVAGMTDALVAVDASWLITDFNQAAEKLFSIGAGEARGRRVDDVVTLVGEGGKLLDDQLLDAGAEPWALLAAVPQPHQSVPVAVSSGALRGPAGEPSGRVMVVRDLRREQEVEQMKTEFLSRVGHELRTPLTGIMGYADILLRRDVPRERARQWHDEILQSGRRLLRIVEMLEFFATSGAGRVRLRPEPIDTRALVNGLTSTWSEKLPEHLTIARRVARNTPSIVADRRWLTMAIDELIDNAVKFSPEGGRILVAAAPGVTADNGSEPTPAGVQISVTDRGVGMTRDENANVFSDFVQADGSDTRRFGGLGLGLAVVRRVVETHGGQVTCRSAEGRGTTFTIVLPSSLNVGRSPTWKARRP